MGPREQPLRVPPRPDRLDAHGPRRLVPAARRARGLPPRVGQRRGLDRELQRAGRGALGPGVDRPGAGARGLLERLRGHRHRARPRRAGRARREPGLPQDARRQHDEQLDQRRRAGPLPLRGRAGREPGADRERPRRRLRAGLDERPDRRCERRRAAPERAAQHHAERRRRRRRAGARVQVALAVGGRGPLPGQREPGRRRPRTGDAARAGGGLRARGLGAGAHARAPGAARAGHRRRVARGAPAAAARPARARAGRRRAA